MLCPVHVISGTPTRRGRDGMSGFRYQEVRVGMKGHRPATLCQPRVSEFVGCRNACVCFLWFLLGEWGWVLHFFLQLACLPMTRSPPPLTDSRYSAHRNVTSYAAFTARHVRPSKALLVNGCHCCQLTEHRCLTCHHLSLDLRS